MALLCFRAYTVSETMPQFHLTLNPHVLTLTTTNYATTTIFWSSTTTAGGHTSFYIARVLCGCPMSSFLFLACFYGNVTAPHTVRAWCTTAFSVVVCWCVWTHTFTETMPSLQEWKRLSLCLCGLWIHQIHICDYLNVFTCKERLHLTPFEVAVLKPSICLRLSALMNAPGRLERRHDKLKEVIFDSKQMCVILGICITLLCVCMRACDAPWQDAFSYTHPKSAFILTSAWHILDRD